MKRIVVFSTNSRASSLIEICRSSGFDVDAFPCEGASIDGLCHELPDALVMDFTADQHGMSTLLGHARDIEALSTVQIVGVIDEAGLSNRSLLRQLDDFVVSPSGTGQIGVRLDLALARGGASVENTVLQSGSVVIDQERYEVFVGSRKVVLTFKEYELLRFLITYPGKVFTRDELLNRVWGYDYYGGTRTVDVHVRRLRSKLDDVEHRMIETVRNVGYRFAGGSRPTTTD